MPIYRFEEVCTSRPTHEVEATTLDEAYRKYCKGESDLAAEPVEEDYLP